MLCAHRLNHQSKPRMNSDICPYIYDIEKKKVLQNITKYYKTIKFLCNTYVFSMMYFKRKNRSPNQALLMKQSRYFMTCVDLCNTFFKSFYDFVILCNTFLGLNQLLFNIYFIVLLNFKFEI